MWAVSQQKHIDLVHSAAWHIRQYGQQIRYELDVQLSRFGTLRRA